jgi:(1->4)-alpha-D-glucan 1-alpha-D-glucosylmutase
LANFINHVLSDRSFLDSFLPFQQRISEYGKYNSLSQAFVKLTCPGVPDVYQGTELWSLSLVDPDNRRPVDYTCRKQYLKEIKEALSKTNGNNLPNISDKM